MAKWEGGCLQNSNERVRFSPSPFMQWELRNGVKHGDIINGMAFLARRNGEWLLVKNGKILDKGKKNDEDSAIIECERRAEIIKEHATSPNGEDI